MIQTTGNRVADQGRPLLLEQLDQALLLPDKPVNRARLAIEEIGDGGLLGAGREREHGRPQLLGIQMRLSRTCAGHDQLMLTYVLGE